ncbi:unnamed protein product [Ilex paraguariensis]|uniref:Histone H2A n=1 Tax=Ilex paraguariensis TaxID=185542 RepID=A0ABC8SEV1_9AQUA
MGAIAVGIVEESDAGVDGKTSTTNPCVVQQIWATSGNSDDLRQLRLQVLELVGNAARDNKKNCIVPRHIQLAVRNDEELSRLLCGFHFPN